ncbi:PepSY domain-containing protein [Paraflavisolibacter sp. H34]|uniref:PepSY domain-containing protein n=1 Tax=Huijunlia imazamoxiresistens TaxID=3127457 RepID=UPI003017F059
MAVSSFLLLTLASLSGIVLAFEPIAEKAKGYKAEGFDTIMLARAVPALKEKYPGLQELSVNDYGFVTIKYADKDGNDQKSYVHPLTGALLGQPGEKLPLFQWMTTLHRSLFLHETGRWMMGITAFLLLLIALSGILLVVQRQKGIRRFFAPVEPTGFAAYYHVVFGRVSLFFILAIALSGAYLSFSRFVLLPQKGKAKVDVEAIREEPAREIPDFPLFRQTPLSRVQTLEFPFSEFPEDYFTLKLKDREVAVNQFTGEVLAQQPYPQAYRLSEFSLRWHTGRSGTVWALVLAVTAAYILFFIYSGFAITLKRRSGRSKNKYKPADCRIIILVGSENGSTFRFASAVYRQLLKHGEKVYLTDMDNYAAFPRAEHLVVMASTYGLGDPPSNAQKFASRLKKYPQVQPVRFSVVGFGSRSYPRFCQFALDAEALLQQQAWAVPVTGMFTVNDRSPQDFSDWLSAWIGQTGLKLMMPRELLLPNQEGLEQLSVVHRSDAREDGAFFIRLKPKRNKAVSGDLLAIYPKNDHRERLYSIGKVAGEVQLSVKLHPHGLGSGFLHSLKEGETIKGRIIKNQHFHFPRKAKQVVLVSNGTGIAPFLGMIAENRGKLPLHLYCGFRTHASFHLYEEALLENKASGRLKALQVAYSREGAKQYVFDLLEKDGDLIGKILSEGGVVMICGSLAMQEDVLKVLDGVCRSIGKGGVEALRASGQILTDCY